MLSILASLEISRDQIGVSYFKNFSAQVRMQPMEQVDNF